MHTEWWKSFSDGLLTYRCNSSENNQIFYSFLMRTFEKQKQKFAFQSSL